MLLVKQKMYLMQVFVNFVCFLKSCWFLGSIPNKIVECTGEKGCIFNFAVFDLLTQNRFEEILR